MSILKRFDDKLPKLMLLQKGEYVTLPETDPLIYYFLPVLGNLYRRRVELALSQCSGGQRVLDVGYGSGVNFLNLAQVYQEIHGIDLFADPVAVSDMWIKHGIEAKLLRGNLLDLPYPDNYFDTVLLVSILEHLKRKEQPLAMKEIYRVLKPGGQMVYGVPLERPLLVFGYRLMGYDIREHHFSSELDVALVARAQFKEREIIALKSPLPILGNIYQVGHFIKGL